jgi:hypothetical protein
MRENTAASVQEFVWQWQRSAQVTQPTEVERAIIAWRQERGADRRGRWRGAVAQVLVALAVRLDRAVAAPTAEERVTSGAR